MKRAFTFRLARVARVREVFEEEARADFTAALSALLAAETHSQKITRALQRGRAAQAEAQGSRSLDVSALLARERSIETLGAALMKARELEAAARGHAEEKRSAWQAKKAEHQALQNLSERHRMRHYEEVSRAENAENDEAAIGRFSHPSG